MGTRRAIAAILTGLVIASCAGSAGTPAPVATTAGAAAASPTATPLVPIKVKVAYTNITGDSLPLWVGLDAGIFKKNGLDVDLISIDGGSRGMSALLANEVHIATLGGAECLSATAGGAKIVVGGVITPVFPYLFMVQASIKTPADLKGKKIGISSIGGSADIATRKVLRDLGLDPEKDVILLALGSHAQRTAALLAGSIQAAVDDPPNTVKLEEGGYHSLYDLAAKKVASAQTALVVQASWLATNREAMQRFVDSVIEAVAYMKKHKPETVAIMRKYFGNSAEKGFEGAVDYYLSEVLATMPFPKLELFADAQAELAKTNEKVKAIDVKTIVDASFVQSAADRGVDRR